MAAVMKETMSSPPRVEPDGRGHELLLLWGLHRRGGNDTKSPVASSSWSEPLDKAVEDEPPEVVAVDRVLAVLARAGYWHTVEIAKVFYLGHPKYDYWQVADKVRRTEGFVRLTLRGLADLVDERVTV